MHCYRTVHLRTLLGAAGILLLALAVTAFGGALQKAALPASADPEGIPVPVLMYHSILKDTAKSGKYVIPPSVLESDLQWLKANGYHAVFPSELIEYVDHGTPLPEKPIVLSFDDGYYNNYLYAYPLMKTYGMKMVLAMIGIHTDRFSETADNNAYYSHCTWEQLREMQDSGAVELANHTYNLHTYDGKRHGCAQNGWEAVADYRAMLSEDVLLLQNKTQAATGVLMQTFVYPFGSYTKETKALVRELGFRCTFSCESGISTVTRDPNSLYELKRFLRPSGANSASFFAKIL